jgi:hypothetical protein
MIVLRTSYMLSLNASFHPCVLTLAAGKRRSLSGDYAHVLLASESWLLS